MDIRERERDGQELNVPGTERENKNEERKEREERRKKENK